MAVYKVIQDIESEDKLLGPLTLKGLVYALVVAACGFVEFKLLFSEVLGPIKWVFILILFLPMLLFGVLASPLGREQPTEVWLLSRIRFLIKARKRVWNQSGLIELVTITAPKKVEAILTKNLSQTEVKSRLSALATTLDSRGWAVKNVNVNLGTFDNYFQETEDNDRLVDTGSIVQEVPVVDVHASDDILDAQNNPTAQNFDSLMVEAENQRKKALQEKLEAARVAVDTEAARIKVEQPKPKPEPESEEPRHSHPEIIHDVRSLQGMGPGGRGFAVPSARAQGVGQVTAEVRAAKLELAQSGNDLSVASIAKLASRDSDNQGEVAIALH
jgi:hypothetical protein